MPPIQAEPCALLFFHVYIYIHTHTQSHHVIYTPDYVAQGDCNHVVKVNFVSSVMDIVGCTMLLVYVHQSPWLVIECIDLFVDVMVSSPPLMILYLSIYPRLPFYRHHHHHVYIGETYSNACVAKSHQVSIRHEGRCEEGSVSSEQVEASTPIDVSSSITSAATEAGVAAAAAAVAVKKKTIKGGGRKNEMIMEEEENEKLIQALKEGTLDRDAAR